jgi:hypothetical protein
MMRLLPSCLTSWGRPCLSTSVSRRGVDCTCGSLCAWVWGRVCPLLGCPPPPTPTHTHTPGSQLPMRGLSRLLST